ncbi:hypothetical protein FOCC_FOCC000771 [Frankliniella occidentalis]|nr:hypothetical protein FOCC_FOCC000771 [Frankliniella occidentalis]
MVSFDMGWSRRAAGRNYDSLNGYGCMVGNFTGKVIDYDTDNRMCMMCEAGHTPDTHDCRLNYFGSAKGMEAHVAKKLVIDSNILKSQNLEVGVLVTDEDCSSVAACRAAASHEIVKQSDKNHASKGVKKVLYGMEKKHGEINAEAIKWLHTCFTYALSQNKGNSAAMAIALRAIPLHTFNDHTLCGNWCGYKRDPENYDHRTVPGGFTNEQLREDLIDVFNKLADNANKFSAAASSNSNESINSMMARKCPKNTCLSMSESADFRYAAVVGKKNLGEVYTQKTMELTTLSPGIPFNTSYVKSTDRATTSRRSLYNTRDFKKKRIIKAKHRANIKYRKEVAEGTTYESNCNLLVLDGVEVIPLGEDDISENWLVGGEAEGVVVLFDLETGGLKADSDILQIGARCGKKIFDTFIRPTKSIPKETTKVNGLTSNSGDLFRHGKQVKAIPLQAAITSFIDFLVSFGKVVYLCAHNAFAFDGPRILAAITRSGQLQRFQSTVKGLVDSLPILKKNRPGKSNALGIVAQDLNISLKDAHDAVADITMLHLILQELKLSASFLISESILVTTLINRMELKRHLENVLTKGMLDKFAKGGLTVESIQDTFNASGVTGVTTLVKSVTKHQASIDKLCDWCQKQNAGHSTTASVTNNTVLPFTASTSTATEPVNEFLHVAWTSNEPEERQSSPDLFKEYLPPDFETSQQLPFGDF